MEKEFNGKTALITGAAGNIGKALGKALHEHGARIVLIDIDEKRGRDAQSEIDPSGKDSLFFKADITSEEDCVNAVNASTEKCDTPDILVNNAGILGKVSVEMIDVSIEDFTRVMDINLKGAFLMSKHVIKNMLSAGKSGNILNISTLAGINPMNYGMPYSVSKAGLIMLSKSIALEYGKYNIRSNTICPGWVMSDLAVTFSKAMGKDVNVFMDSVGKKSVFSRSCSIKDITSLSLFLLSDNSSFITGQTYALDGGSMLQ